MLDFLCKESYDLRDFVALITFLRSPDGCPWDQVQTHESIRRNFLEETYEVCEAIDAGDTAHLKEELGDVLMQVLFHTDIEREAGHFDIDDVADAACKKLVYRHPHVFRRDEPDAPDWDTIKQRERAQTTTAEAMDSVARSLPALWRCEKIQAKAARTGFEWPDADAALDKVAEETRELRVLEDTDDIVEGIKLVKKYMNLSTVIIGIEDNKPQAIAKLQAAVADIEGASVKALKAQYPQGGEKVLIYECTGKIVPEGKLPSDVGCVVMNVSSIAFVAKYMRTGMPLITKRLTVDGDAIAEPKNVEVAIGTSFSDVIDFCGGFKTEPKKIIMGGPMMGFAVPTINYPVLKNNNAILAFSAAKTAEAEKPETPCIRCARCVNVCPMHLTPLFMNMFAKARRWSEVEEEYRIMDCMECGSCQYVCPARIPLVQQFRTAKFAIRQQAAKK